VSTSIDARDLEGRTIYASDGEKLGKVDEVLVDGAGVTQYVRVKSGWFGTKTHVVPIQGITPSGDDLTVPYTKEQLESAPTYDEGADIDYETERSLGGHYGTDVRDWDDTRDVLRGEDLSRGPTPETRHPEGGLDDVRDTTQGPTPETRRTMRATEEDSRAAGQPGSDPRTRGDVVGTQDARRAETGRVRLRRWSEAEDADRVRGR
jgi:sporulation protein YlmC with PRC-barrel domain